MYEAKQNKEKVSRRIEGNRLTLTTDEKWRKKYHCKTIQKHSYTGSLTDGKYLKVLNKELLFPINEEDIVQITSRFVTFEVNDKGFVEHIKPKEFLLSDSQSTSSIKKKDKINIGSLEYHETIRKLLESDSINVETGERRYNYDPERGVTIGQILKESQKGLPKFTKEAWREKDKWLMSTVSGTEVLSTKNADGIFDFVIITPNRLKMIKRQQQGAGHSSFGNTVLMAGEIKFYDGKLIEWSTRSGHFMPPTELAIQTGLDMACLRGFRSLSNQKDQTTPDEIEENVNTVNKIGVKELTTIISQIIVEDKQSLKIMIDKAKENKKKFAFQSWCLKQEEIKNIQKNNGMSNNDIRKILEDINYEAFI